MHKQLTGSSNKLWLFFSNDILKKVPNSSKTYHYYTMSKVWSIPTKNKKKTVNSFSMDGPNLPDLQSICIRLIIFPLFSSYVFLARAENSDGLSHPSPVSERVRTLRLMSSDFNDLERNGQPIDLADVQNTLLSKVVELSSVEAISSTGMY